MSSRKLKRVLLLANLPPDERNGGSGYVLAELISLLRREAGEVSLLVLPIIGLGAAKRGSRYVATVMALIQGFHAVMRNQADVVICNGGVWGLLVWLLSKRRHHSPPIVQFSNGVESHCETWMSRAIRDGMTRAPRWFQRGSLTWVYDLAYRYADHVTVPGSLDARHLAGTLHIAPEAITTVGNPLAKEFAGRPVTFQRPNKVGFCGNWTTIKNTELVLHDVAEFLADNGEWVFEAVGNGTETIAHRGAVGRRMRGLGRISRQELLRWYESCSIIVMPSFFESFGLAAVEAMACGCAVVAGRTVSAASDLEHEQQVFLLPEVRTPFLRDALTRLAADEGLRERIARGGYAAVQRLNVLAWQDRVRATLFYQIDRTHSQPRSEKYGDEARP